MAMTGYASTYKRNAVEGYIHGQRALTLPDPYYYAIHFATVLTLDANSGDNTVVTAHPMGAGGKLIVGAGTSDAEEQEVDSISGVGPYTITLVGTLANDHFIDDYVAFDPGPDCEYINEHSGDAYARAQLDNDTISFPDPSDGETDSGAQITWLTPSDVWGMGTHVIEWDDPTAGNPWDIALMSSFPIFDTTTPNPKIVIGNMINEIVVPE